MVNNKHINNIVQLFILYNCAREIKHSLVLLAVALIYEESVGERMIKLSNVVFYAAAYFAHNSRLG